MIDAPSAVTGQQATDRPAERTYGNWRKPASPGVGNLGLGGTVVLFGGMMLVVIALTIDLVAGAVVGVLLSAALALLFFKDRYGRTLLQRIVARAAWEHGRSRGQHLYRSGPLSKAGMTSFRLPGLAATMTVHHATDGYGRPFGLIEVPQAGHFSAVFECAGDGAALVDSDQVDTWVAYWGAWLASLAHEPGIVAAAVSVETAPDPGTRLADEVRTQVRPQAPPLARQVLEQVVRQYPPGSAQITARVCVTYSAVPRPGAHRRDRNEMAAEIGTRLPGLSAGLGMTGAGEAVPMTERQIAEMVRVAYDPSVHSLIEASRASGGSALTWADAGPVMAQENIGDYRHDSAASITWGMSEAPRGEVLSNVLAGLLAPHRDIARKRVTILYRPHHPDRAAQIVENDRRNATFRLGGSKPPARDVANAVAAEQAAREEAKGAGLVRFAILVTATVESYDDLPAAATAVDVLAPPARIQLRRMYGSQATAFAASLPIGIVLPDHLMVPQFIRASA